MLTQAQRAKMMEPPRRLIDMVLDTDAYNEIDDQYAVAYAVHARKKLRVKAFYAAPFTNERSSGPTDGMELEHWLRGKKPSVRLPHRPYHRGVEG